MNATSQPPILAATILNDIPTIDADSCSVGRMNGINDDYALYVPGVGACVADGVGGAPMGDAIARYACHVAMCALCDGSNALEAIEAARDRVEEFVRTVESPHSGASVMVIKFSGRTVQAAWQGDVGLFARFHKEEGDGVLSSLGSEDSACMPLGVSTASQIGCMQLSSGDLACLVACTDGVWRTLGTRAIATIMKTAASAREAAARLVLGGRRLDDATALVIRPVLLA